MVFQYPKTQHTRKHGPRGYQSYHSYKDWLRDEFFFCCVYCLRREKWLGGPDSFGVDHFVPKSFDLSLVLIYSNLLYACVKCNSMKQDLVAQLIDPCVEGYGQHLEVSDDGKITAKTREGNILVEFLRLDHPSYSDYRKRILDLWKLSEREAVFKEWFSFPSDLPDLRTRRPQGNNRAEGLDQSYYVLREQGKLPEVY